MPTLADLEALIARCPTTDNHDTWTKDQKRALLTLYHYHRGHEVINSLFDYATGDYLGVKPSTAIFNPTPPPRFKRYPRLG